MQAVVSILPFLGCAASGALLTLLLSRRLRAPVLTTVAEVEHWPERPTTPSPTVRTTSRKPQLERIAEMAGIPQHCSLTQRDMIVRLPSNRTIVVDAKTSSVRLLEAIVSGDENRRRCARSELVATVRRRAEALRRASYWHQFNRAPDFVVLFLPGALFTIVMREDPELFETCSAHNVLVVTPTTLIALLKAVGHAWVRAAAARNAQDMANVSRDLYDRLKAIADAPLDPVPAFAGCSFRII